MPGLHGTSALMSVNKVNVAGRKAASAALQPHLTQQMQNVPAGSHVRTNFMLAWVDSPSLASKEMSKSHLCSRRALLLRQKGNGCVSFAAVERRGTA